MVFKIANNIKISKYSKILKILNILLEILRSF